MKKLTLKILSNALLDEFLKLVDKNAADSFAALTDSELSVKSFSFYTSVSAVYSSKIEGEDIEMDSYIKHKKLGVKFLPDYTRKIDDLYDAYQFAQKTKLNKAGVNAVHKLLTKHILQAPQRGTTRTNNMFVIAPDGKIEYIACVPGKVKEELDKLFYDIALLLKAPLNFAETFFFSSFIHLVFVKIHPFNDGNGRTARLLEKWFLAQKLGDKAWFIQSEKYYYDHHQQYYANIRLMGLEYDLLDYKQALPFLLMLPNCIKQKMPS